MFWCLFVCCFFLKPKTAYEMRISDWSSDVCSPDLLAAVGKPLAAPSANASGRISPPRASHVAASLGGRIPRIVDGGATGHGLESTIVAVTGGEIRLLGPGPISNFGVPV